MCPAATFYLSIWGKAGLNGSFVIAIYTFTEIRDLETPEY
jgi:hypothetical protein